MSDIIDVDFRYVMRMQENTVYGIKILQYRKMIGVQGLHGRWTEWQDVRTEEE